MSRNGRATSPPLVAGFWRIYADSVLGTTPPQNCQNPPLSVSRNTPISPLSIRAIRFRKHPPEAPSETSTRGCAKTPSRLGHIWSTSGTHRGRCWRTSALFSPPVSYRCSTDTRGCGARLLGTTTASPRSCWATAAPPPRPAARASGARQARRWPRARPPCSRYASATRCRKRRGARRSLPAAP